MGAIFFKKRSIGSLKLKTKLLAAFFLMAIIAGLGGLANLIYIDLIKSKVEAVSDLAFPMASLAKRLNSDMKDANIVLLELLGSQKNDTIQQSAHNLERSEKQVQTQLDAMAHLAKQKNFDVNLTQVQSLQTSFFKKAREALALHQAMLKKQSLENSILTEFTQAKNNAEKILKNFSQTVQSNLNEKEELAKTQEQAGTATTENLNGFIFEIFSRDFPLMSACGIMQSYFIELNNSAISYMTEQDFEKLSAMEKEFGKLIKKSQNRLKRVNRIVKGSSQEADVNKLFEHLKLFQSNVLSDQGLFAVHKGFLMDHRHVQDQLEQLEQARKKYKSVIDLIVQSTDDLKTVAQDSMTSAVKEAQKVIISVVLTCVVLALVLGGPFFKFHHPSPGANCSIGKNDWPRPFHGPKPLGPKGTNSAIWPRPSMQWPKPSRITTTPSIKT